MPVLSAVIITKNEAANIADCLDSVAFCDERVVVDSGSDDDTVRIAEGKGARVSRHEFEGFGRQRSHALSLAQGDWILSIDADERISPALAAEIQKAVREGTFDGYEMSRSSSFCGRVMRHSGWSPDRVLRLCRRGRARWSDDLVHERLICDGPVARLSHPLTHFPVREIGDALSRMDRYSTAGAEMLFARGRRVWFVTGILRGAYAFFRTYMLRAGFLDGREGFLLAVLNAEGTYYRYMKLWLMNRTRGR